MSHRVLSSDFIVLTSYGASSHPQQSLTPLISNAGFHRLTSYLQDELRWMQDGDKESGVEVDECGWLTL